MKKYGSLFLIFSLPIIVFAQATDFQQGSPTTQGTPTTCWFWSPSQATPTTSSIIWLAQGSSTIYSRDGEAPGDALLMAQFDIPADANAGLWDVVVPTMAEGTLTLQDGFMVAQPGDGTGDCLVDTTPPTINSVSRASVIELKPYLKFSSC